MLCEKCVHKDECGNGINLSIILDCTEFIELPEGKELGKELGKEKEFVNEKK